LKVPDWDLALVLDVLRKEPFEPLETISLKFLTLKMTFLLAFASGRRRGEIHALTRELLMHSESWDEITVNPDVNFIAKTELAKGNSVTREVSLKSLSTFLGPDMEEDMRLCPVRAIRVYLERTDQIRGSRKKLIMSFKKGFNQEISKNTISSYLKRLIQAAYQNAGPEERKVRQIKAHEVRAVSASWAFFSNMAVEDIMRSCNWKSHNTFTNFYLRDLTMMKENMMKLGPVACGGGITHCRESRGHRRNWEKKKSKTI